MREDLDLTNFTAGELSPRLRGRPDQAKYYNGCAELVNMVVLPQGGATRRPGTVLAALAKDQGAGLFRVRTVPFVFSVLQAYDLEFSAGNARIYMNRAVVLSGGVPVDVAVPYTQGDLAKLSWTQSADTLFLFHPLYPLATLTRASHTSWTYTVVAVRDGPYLPANTTPTTLTVNGTTGNVTITASSTVGINPTTPNAPPSGQGWLTTDVGRLVRMQVGAAWGWLVITARVNSLVANATVQAAVTGVVNGAAGAIGGTTPTTIWQLGKWCTTTGFPYCGGFWQGRLFACGTNNEPNALQGSVSGDYITFSGSDSAGTVTAAHAMSWLINDDQVNAVRAISAAGSVQAAQLGVFTGGSEHVFQPANLNDALSPTNVQTYRESTYGAAADVPVLRIGKCVLFANAAGRKLHEWTFASILNGYLGPDLLVWCDHLARGATEAGSGLRTMCWQQKPNLVVWAIRNDGQLLSFTYDGPAGPGSIQSQQVFAGARHVLGGQYYGGPPVVESISVIPSQDGTYDELWLCVLRTIAGVPTRTIEVLDKYFEGRRAEDAYFVDCGLKSTLAQPAATVTPTGFTASWVPGSAPMTAAPAFTGSGTLTAGAAVFAAGDVGKIVRLNGGRLTVTGYASTTVVTAEVSQAMANLAPAASGAWSMTAPSLSFAGLDHLNGETVAILGDGAVYPSQVVTSGAVPLAGGGAGASLAAIGLPCTPVLVTMPFEPQRAAAAAAHGKAKRVDTMWVRFLDTLGCDFGRRITDPMTKAVRDWLEPLQSRSAADPMGQAPPLFSGARRLLPQGGFDLEGQVVITSEEPTPLTVLAIFVSANTGELP